MLTIREEAGNYVALDAREKLERSDYERITPQLEALIARHGKLRVLIVLHDFAGWTPGALLDDLRFDVHHHTDFERVAVVGGKTWQAVVTKLTKPFFSGEMQFFDAEPEARAWLKEAVTAA